LFDGRDHVDQPEVEQVGRGHGVVSHLHRNLNNGIERVSASQERRMQRKLRRRLLPATAEATEDDWKKTRENTAA